MAEKLGQSTMDELTAKHRVFSSPEILESILLQLPIRDLLVTAQRINHAWFNLISLSPKIQEALFFKPQSRASNQGQSFNPLLLASFTSWFKNPSSELTGRLATSVTFHDLDWNSSAAKRGAYTRKEASWRRMLPVQPAVPQLDVVKRSHSMGGNSECLGEACFKDGMRMGMLYDLAQQEAKIPITRVGVRWVRDETQSLLGGLAKTLGMGKERDRVVVNINWVVQCCIGLPDHLGPEFKSLGYEEVKVKWGPWKRMPFR